LLGKAYDFSEIVAKFRYLGTNITYKSSFCKEAKSRVNSGQKLLFSRPLSKERDKVVRGWRIVHNEELDNLCSSPHIIRTIK
jgi:hypothetical protein